MLRITSLVFLLLAPALVTPATIGSRQTSASYVVENQCPGPVKLYIAGKLDSTLALKGTVTKTNLGGNTGFFYTDANGGNVDGSRTLRAGFYLEQGKVAPTYYYLVKDPAYINAGMSITPVGANPKNGFCNVATCSDKNCTTAFSQPPTRFPASTSAPPAAPLFQCTANISTYKITFCPDGKWPTVTVVVPPTVGVAIHPNGNPNKCMDVRGAIYANGTPVQIYDCNGTGAQKWVLNKLSTKVRVDGTNFCLDAGTTAANGVGLKIWQCYDNLPAQQWYYTADNRIALENQGFCADLAEGVLSNANKIQTWRCTDNNNNQVWTL